MSGPIPALLQEEVRRLKPQLLPRLQRERANALAAIIDGPGGFSERMSYWPEYLDLTARIETQDRGTP